MDIYDGHNTKCLIFLIFFALKKLWFFSQAIHHDFARKFCSRGKSWKNVPFMQNYDTFKVEKVLKKIQVYDDKC